MNRATTYRRLNKLADYLETVPRKEFDTTCCAQTPYCLPAWHRLTIDPALANCKGQ